MDNSRKTNRLAVVSFISGLIALSSIVIIFAFYNLVAGYVFITDGILIPIRNISVVVALVTGILALRDIKKKGHTEKGKILAWIGIGLGATWILVGALVGLTFLLSTILESF